MVTNEELKIEQFVTVLLVASALKLIVAVPAVAAVDKFAIVSELLPVQPVNSYIVGTVEIN